MYNLGEENMMKKTIWILIMISLVSCNNNYTFIKGDNNYINAKQRIDSIQLQKNEFKPPLRWMK